MICLVMSVANLMNYAGMTSSIALAVATAGALFPLFSPIIGWIGVFVTGSVTNNNVLFAGLQASTAHQIGVDPAMLVAANTSGGVMGKIVSRSRLRWRLPLLMRRVRNRRLPLWQSGTASSCWCCCAFGRICSRLSCTSCFRLVAFLIGEEPNRCVERSLRCLVVTSVQPICGIQRHTMRIIHGAG